MNKTTNILMNITLAGAALIATTSTLPASVASAAQSEKGYVITESPVASQTVTNKTIKKAANNKYEVAGIDDPAAFDAFFAKLQQAVKKNDKKAVSAFVHYPLRVNSDSGTYFFATPERFMAKYNSIITPKVKKALVSSTNKDLFATWQGVATDGGTVWMDNSNNKLGIWSINK